MASGDHGRALGAGTTGPPVGCEPSTLLMNPDAGNAGNAEIRTRRGFLHFLHFLQTDWKPQTGTPEKRSALLSVS